MRRVDPRGAHDEMPATGFMQRTLAGEFARAIDRERRRRIRLAPWHRAGTVEQIVGREVNHRNIVPCGPGCDRGGRLRIDPERELALVFGEIDRGVGGRIDDQIRRQPLERRGDGAG